MTINSSDPKERRSVPRPNDTVGKTSPYARFIPREELNSFAAWSPGDISGGPAKARPAQPASPSEVAAVVARAHAAELKTARQSGYQDGYRDGLVALEGFKQSFARQTTQQVGSLLTSLDEQLSALQDQMATTLLATATNLARQVVRSELKHRPDAVASVAREALDTLLLSARHITLRVHPDDHALIHEGAGEVLAARGARLVSDSGIVRGGCLVESDIGVIDATLETRWRRANGVLGGDAPWQEASDAGDRAP